MTESVTYEELMKAFDLSKIDDILKMAAKAQEDFAFQGFDPAVAAAKVKKMSMDELVTIITSFIVRGTKFTNAKKSMKAEAVTKFEALAIKFGLKETAGSTDRRNSDLTAPRVAAVIPKVSVPVANRLNVNHFPSSKLFTMLPGAFRSSIGSTLLGETIPNNTVTKRALAVYQICFSHLTNKNNLPDVGKRCKLALDAAERSTFIPAKEKIRLLEKCYTTQVVVGAALTLAHLYEEKGLDVCIQDVLKLESESEVTEDSVIDTAEAFKTKWISFH